MKSTYLKRILLIILLTLFLSAILTAIVFSYTGRTVFARMKAEELGPRADYIATLTAGYQQGTITRSEFQRMLNYDTRVWDASVYIFDANSRAIARPEGVHAKAIQQTLKSYVPRVLLGETLTSTTNLGGLGVVVGRPTYAANGTVIGAVFLTKPLVEVNSALSGLIKALLISLLAATLIMLIPAYFASKNLSRPLKQMSTVAHAMAEGNFSVRAAEIGTVETQQLGYALNTLSGKLSRTINDLTLERNRLRSILDGMSEGIIATDGISEITLVNPAAVTLLGGVKEQPVEMLAAYIPVKESIDLAIRECKVSTREITVGEAVLLVAATPLLAEDNMVAGTVCLIRDITESIRLEKTRREYVANVSHELRTPIASIRSLADALSDGMVKKEEDKQRYYGYILRESMRLSRLINDLLELSRLQSGTVALQKQSVDVEEMLLDAAERYREIAQESGLDFVLSVPENCPAVFTNPDRAEQVLVALLDNAVRYTPDGGEIRLRAYDEGERLRICVENPGEIAQEDLPHLFERFYKADKAHSGEGTGLGLSIAEEIMHHLGEEINVQNFDGLVVFSFTLKKAV